MDIAVISSSRTSLYAYLCACTHPYIYMQTFILTYAAKYMHSVYLLSIANQDLSVIHSKNLNSSLSLIPKDNILTHQHFPSFVSFFDFCFVSFFTYMCNNIKYVYVYNNIHTYIHFLYIHTLCYIHTKCMHITIHTKTHISTGILESHHWTCFPC